MNALSFFFLKFFLKFLPALRDDYTSDKEKYGMAGEKERFYGENRPIYDDKIYKLCYTFHRKTIVG